MPGLTFSSAPGANRAPAVPLPKRVAIVNDLTGFGRCSLAVELPVISAMGIQCCPVPTAILSNHCEFDRFFFDDYTANLPAYLAEWRHLGLRFDGIYTGFLGSEKQIELVAGFIREFAAKDALIMVDPVMGDEGVIPPPYNDALCDNLRHLAALADVITPNLTEAARLCHLAYHPFPSNEELHQMGEKLLAIGCKAAIITGIKRGRQMGNMIFSRCEGSTKVSAVWNDLCGERRVGTGDLFSSIVLGGLMYHLPLHEAVQRAADFIEKSLRFSEQNHLPLEEGIAFEPLLSALTSAARLSSGGVSNHSTEH